MFTQALAKHAEALGVRFMFNTGIDRIVTEGARVSGVATSAGMLQADSYVLALGSWSSRLVAPLGISLPVYPVKGYSITVQLDAPQSRNAAPTVSLLDEAAKIVTSRLGADRFRVAGTAEFNGFNRDIRADRIQPLVDWVRHHFPKIDTSKVVPWAGLRPMMPNMMPVVRAGRIPGVFYNTGHGHLGWTLSAATAQMAAQAIDDWRDLDTPPMAPSFGAGLDVPADARKAEINPPSSGLLRTSPEE